MKFPSNKECNGGFFDRHKWKKTQIDVNEWIQVCRKCRKTQKIKERTYTEERYTEPLYDTWDGRYSPSWNRAPGYTGRMIRPSRLIKKERKTKDIEDISETEYERLMNAYQQECQKYVSRTPWIEKRKIRKEEWAKGAPERARRAEIEAKKEKQRQQEKIRLARESARIYEEKKSKIKSGVSSECVECGRLFIPDRPTSKRNINWRCDECYDQLDGYHRIGHTVSQRNRHYARHSFDYARRRKEIVLEDGIWEVGQVMIFSPETGDAEIKLQEELSIEELIWIKGKTTDFEQVVTQIVVGEMEVEAADKGQTIRMKIDCPIQEGDKIYKYMSRDRKITNAHGKRIFNVECPKCKYIYEKNDCSCPRCGFETPQENGFAKSVGVNGDKSNVVELNSLNLEEFLKTDQLVLLGFFAKWYMPSRIMESMIERLSRVFNGKVEIGKIDVDEEPELFKHYNSKRVNKHYKFSRIPYFIFIKDKKVVEISPPRNFKAFQKIINEIIDG